MHLVKLMLYVHRVGNIYLCIVLLTYTQYQSIIFSVRRVVNSNGYTNLCLDKFGVLRKNPYGCK